MWTHRILLESYQHSSTSFVTLTYSDEHLPTLGTLDPTHSQNWLKRLRKAIEPSKIRFYLVGEYGDETHRPHYHAALFGFPHCFNGNTREGPRGTGPDWQNCCPSCRLVGTTWGKGKIFQGILEADSAQYLAGYVTKKMTSKYDPRLEGRYPEFARMSRMPGLGYDALHELASQLMVFNLDTSQTDVPSALRHGKKLLPLGRYLRRKLRLLVGKDEKTPDAILQQISEEMLPLLIRSKTSKTAPSLKLQIEEELLGQKINLEAREKLFQQRKHL